MLSFKRVPLVVALALAAAGTAQAQTPAPADKKPPVVSIDSRFSQWVGCWRLEDDVIGSGLRMCVIPDKVFNVRLETLIGAQRGEVSSLVPDKVAHPVSDPTCKGTERAEWSSDGLRIFRFAEVTCGTEPARKLSSVIFLNDGPVLVEVQHVDSGLSQSVRAKRYRRALDQSLPDGSIAPQPSIRAADVAMTGAWDTDDVIEASAKLPADALQAAITEVDRPFALNKKTLVALSDAKVSEGVIDLMIALTYPKRLVVQRASAPSGGTYMGSGLISMGDPFYDPLFFSPIIPADCFSVYRYGYYSNYGGRCGWYNSAFGYGYAYPYYGRYGGYGYYDTYYPWVSVGGPIVSVPGTGVTPQPEGRVINGRGYTQIRPREAEPTVNSGRGYTSGNSGSNSSGGSSGVSSGGYSSGSSGGSSGGSSSGGGGERTAVSRPPGGN